MHQFENRTATGLEAKLLSFHSPGHVRLLAGPPCEDFSIF